MTTAISIKHAMPRQGVSMENEWTDQDRIDFLQALTDRADYTGKVVLRESGTARGWRLHETELPGATANVRDAIDAMMSDPDYEDQIRRVLRNDEA